MSEYERNRGKFTIELSSKDEDIIHKIKDLIPYNYILNNSIIDSMKYLNRTDKSIKMRLWRLKKECN